MGDDVISRVEELTAIKDSAEAALQSCQPMIFIGTRRRREHYRLRYALADIVFRAEAALDRLSPDLENEKGKPNGRT